LVAGGEWPADLVPGTNNFAKGQGGPSLHELNIKDLFPAGAKRLELIGPKTRGLD